MIGVQEILVILAILAVLALPVVAVVLVVVLLVRGTAQKTKWGVNLSPPSACPGCGHPLPAVRMPRNARQAVWGGWTCERCGVELDKWGRPIGPRAQAHR